MMPLGDLARECNLIHDVMALCMKSHCKIGKGNQFTHSARWLCSDIICMLIAHQDDRT